MMLSRYRHENLISLLGYCIEDGEMILIYEHAARGTKLPHNPNERQQRVLHCDIKSANILLDDNLNAKVSDFGLSKMGSADQQYSVIVTNAVALLSRFEEITRNRPSDVSCCEKLKNAFERQERHDIIFKDPLPKEYEEIVQVCNSPLRVPGDSLLRLLWDFKARLRASILEQSNLIHVNLSFDIRRRPQHKTADFQFEFEYRRNRLLVAGIEFQPSEAKWFSLNEKGEHCEMISIEDCLIPNENSPFSILGILWSGDLFPKGLYRTCYMGLYVKTQFLSPSITYTVNLVLDSFSFGEQAYVDLKYRLKGETTTSTVYLANPRKDDDFFMAELYQFTSDGSIVDLEIIFENLWLPGKQLL
ncbi:kinase-like domain, phloem protein 2-like protein [Tanacetum coccineum]